MADLLVVTAEVEDRPQLGAVLDAFTEVIATEPDACTYCLRNAESDTPIRPPVHKDWHGTPNCRCTVVRVNLSEHI